MKPPLPPFGALASSVPPTLLPAAMPPSRVMTPSWFSTVRASITPVLLTTLASKVSFAPAVMITMPPSARISCLFSARLFNTLWSTCMLTRLLPLKVSVDGAARPQGHGAELRGDYALVADGVAKQRDRAAVGRMNGALVNDAAGAGAGEGSFIAVQAGVVDIQS